MASSRVQREWSQSSRSTHVKHLEIDFSDVLRFGTLVVSGPGGVGKTENMCRFIGHVAPTGIFDRIYMVGNTHKTCENFVPKLLRYIHDPCVKIIHYEGIERSCINRDLLEYVRKLGLVPSAACLVCPYNARYHGVTIHRVLRDVLRSKQRVIRSSQLKVQVLPQGYICGCSLIKQLVISPSLDTVLERAGGRYIFIVPAATILNYSFVRAWVGSAKRLRRRRRYLFAIDEPDVLLLRGVPYRIYEPRFTHFDYEVLQELRRRVKSYDPLDFINIYSELYHQLHDRSYREFSRFIKDLVKDRKVWRVVKCVERRLKEIVKLAIREGEETFLQRAVHGLNTHTLECLRRAVDCVDPRNHLANIIDVHEDYVEVCDYDLVYNLVLRYNYPFETIYKCVTSATLPQLHGVKMRVLNVVPRNVYTLLFRFYIDPKMRVVEFVRNPRPCLVKICRLIRSIHDIGKSAVGYGPTRFIIWFPSSQAYRPVAKLATGIGKVVAGSPDQDMCTVRIGSFTLMMTYLGSRYNRSIDVPDYDGCVVMAPFTRRPRVKGITYTEFDREYAVFEAVQAAFRIVRSLEPETPKFIAFETSLLAPPYAQYVPEYVLELLRTSRLGTIELVK